MFFRSQKDKPVRVPSNSAAHEPGWGLAIDYDYFVGVVTQQAQKQETHLSIGISQQANDPVFPRRTAVAPQEVEAFQR